MCLLWQAVQLNNVVDHTFPLLCFKQHRCVVLLHVSTNWITKKTKKKTFLPASSHMGSQTYQGAFNLPLIDMKLVGETLLQVQLVSHLHRCLLNYSSRHACIGVCMCVCVCVRVCLVHEGPPKGSCEVMSDALRHMKQMQQRRRRTAWGHTPRHNQTQTGGGVNTYTCECHWQTPAWQRGGRKGGWREYVCFCEGVLKVEGKWEDNGEMKLLARVYFLVNTHTHTHIPCLLCSNAPVPHWSQLTRRRRHAYTNTDAPKLTNIIDIYHINNESAALGLCSPPEPQDQKERLVVVSAHWS